MPGSFQWAKYEGGLAPAWIGFGERPAAEREIQGPFDPTPVEMKINRLYLLTNSGPKTIPFPHKDTMPLHLLYQDQTSKASGELSIVAGDSLGYYKKYSLFSFKEKLEEIAAFELFPYIDLLNAKGLPVAGALGSNSFFHETSLGGARMVAIERTGSQVSIVSRRIDKQSKEPILRILSFRWRKHHLPDTKHHRAQRERHPK